MYTAGEKEEKERGERQRGLGGRVERCVCVRVWFIRDKERDEEERRDRERREDRSSHESTRWRTIRNERLAVVFFWSVTRLAARASDWFLSALGNVHCVLQQPPPGISSSTPRRLECARDSCTVHFIDGRKTGPPASYIKLR